MGIGKTSWAIQTVKSHPEKNYIYITPLLTETTRVVNSVAPEKRLIQPRNTGKGKLTSLNKLLSKGESISSTHELFKHLNAQSHEYIKQMGYTLILDETLDVVAQYENMTFDLLRSFVGSKWVHVDDDGFIHWHEDVKVSDPNFEEIKRLSENHNLVCINNKILIWRYPPDVFALFDEVYILTYMFEANIMAAYLKAYGIEYVKKSVSNEEGAYMLVDFTHFDASVYAPLINIYQGKLNSNFPQEKSSMSKNWFKDPKNNAYIKKLRNNVLNYFQNICHAKRGSIMWTCFLGDLQRLKGRGYTKAHVACNCRSTNDYSGCYNLAYTVNRFLSPGVVAFFHKHGVKMDSDMYALSEMIQWIWRSRVRNGESINIYVASDRMRKLLEDWLAGKI